MIRGFSDGIVALGAHDATFERNVAAGNAEYGITAFGSTGTRMLFNRASGSGEAGFYIGDSPAADATLIGNDSSGNLFGILIRNAQHGKAVANSIHGNCAGVAVLADLPGPAGLFHLTGNQIRTNTKACAAGEDIPFPLSGVGVLLLGATGVQINGNLITGNAPSADTQFSGGVVVASGPGDPATAPADNQVHGNRILRNDPDVFWDGTAPATASAATSAAPAHRRDCATKSDRTGAGLPLRSGLRGHRRSTLRHEHLVRLTGDGPAAWWQARLLAQRGTPLIRITRRIRAVHRGPRVGVCRAHPASRSSRVRSDAASLSAGALARSAGLLAVLAGPVPPGKSAPAAMAADISPGGLR